MPKWSHYLEVDDDDELPRESFQKIKKGQKHSEEVRKAEKKKKKPHDDVLIIPDS